ncbi:LysE family translocator [Palleronia pelagia]|uniref:LysE type translocator n=1 Tax=Palleronia pelagia TaxID=387096 RepID=A0A1H8LBS6_9RHOB|nr:LysE family translocator [Palleronia pelagia]SEO02624.1 LysE type translocator [Palleronia pelagia]
MTPEIWIALATANFAAYLAPGQNMALVGAATARSGMPGGVAAVAGILVAEAVWTAIALGLIITAREIDSEVMLCLQVASGAFLVWCGWKVLTTSADGDTTPIESKGSHIRLFLHGIWVGLANPLALVFFVSIFPGLLKASLTHEPLGLLFFSGTAVVISSLAALAPYLAMSRMLVVAGQARRLNAVSGGALLLVGVAAIAWSAV